MDCIYIAPLSKALYNLCLSFTHSHTHSHTNSDWLRCSSGAIGANQSDDSSSLLSHIAPLSRAFNPLPSYGVEASCHEVKLTLMSGVHSPSEPALLKPIKQKRLDGLNAGPASSSGPVCWWYFRHLATMALNQSLSRQRQNTYPPSLGKKHERAVHQHARFHRPTCNQLLPVHLHFFLFPLMYISQPWKTAGVDLMWQYESE